MSRASQIALHSFASCHFGSRDQPLKMVDYLVESGWVWVVDLSSAMIPSRKKA